MSSWKEKYNKKYGFKKSDSHSLSDIAKTTGISKKGIQKIYNKGIGAYKTNPQSVRPTVTSKEQWAYGRVYSAVMGGKASKVDAKELKMEKGGSVSTINDRIKFLKFLLNYDRFGRSEYELMNINNELQNLIRKSFRVGGKVGVDSSNQYVKGETDKKINWSEYYAKGGIMDKNIKSKLFDSNGERKIDNESIEILTEYVNSLPQTKSMHFDNKSGRYTPERRMVHKKILDSFKDNLVCIESDEPIAILMGGSPASGKSSFLRKYAPYLLSTELLRIDADEVRGMLPEYEGWNASQTHLETKDIVNTLLSDKTIGLPCNFDLIYDGTMNNTKSYLPLIKLLKQLGYKIYVVYVDNVPKSEIIERALNRYKNSGRFVPLEVIEDFFDKGKSALNEIKEKADGYMIVDGSSNDYEIIEEGGFKLPQNREYSILGRELQDYDSATNNSFAKGGDIGDKIRLLKSEGYPQKQAVAIALDMKDRGKFEKGGETDFNPDGAIKGKVVHASGDAGGMLVGKRHSEGGIKAVNKSTGQPLEMEGGEVVITRDAVSDNKKRSFNGKMMTNRQILSEINESGGGVSFADGGELPNQVSFDCEANYEFGGQNMCGKDLAFAMGGTVTTAIVTDPNEAMADLQSTYGFGDVYKAGGYISKGTKKDSIMKLPYKELDVVGGKLKPNGIKRTLILPVNFFNVRMTTKGKVTDALLKLKRTRQIPFEYEGADSISSEAFGYNSGELNISKQDITLGSYILDEIQATQLINFEVIRRMRSGGNPYFDDEKISEVAEYYISTQQEESGIINDVGQYLIDIEKDRIVISLRKFSKYFDIVFRNIKSNNTYYPSMEEIDKIINPTYDPIVEVSVSIADDENEVIVNSFAELVKVCKDYVNALTREPNYIGFYLRAKNSNNKFYEFKLEGITRQPSWGNYRAKSQFGYKTLKKNNFLPFLYTFLYQLYNTTYYTEGGGQCNVMPFLVGNSDLAIQNAEKRAEENEKRKAEERKRKAEQKYIESVAFTNFPEFKESALKQINELDKTEKQLTKLLPFFQGVTNSFQKIKILKELRKTYLLKEEIKLTNPEENFEFISPSFLLDYYYTQTTQSPVVKLEKASNLKTPNGKESVLPKRAYVNVRTEKFKEWFGDWIQAYEDNNYSNCSKMINEETKEPKIFYHGVRKFKKGIGGGNLGSGVTRPFGAFTPTEFPASYFSDKISYAEFYSGQSSNLPKPIQSDGFIYPVFLNIRNPLDLRPLGFEASFKDFRSFVMLSVGVKIEYTKQLLDMVKDINKPMPVWSFIRNDVRILEILRKSGIDGIIQIGDIPLYKKNGEVEEDRSKWIQEVEFLTFYPNQIKSVTVKKSLFSSLFDDIRFKKGGYVSI